MIRTLQPDIIINDRINIPQDYDTPEQFIPATGIPGRDWETCMTMNDTWGFKSYDTDWKSSEDLIRKLVDIVSKGGNFLLNVGPTSEGLIPQASADRLADMGRWMNLNSESIYGTTASVFRKLGWGRCTVKPGKLYLHVFQWPQDGKLVVPGLKNEVTAAYILSDLKKAPLAVERSGEMTTVTVPAKAYDPMDTVVVLEITGTPDVAPQPIKPQADGSILLKAIDADIHGSGLSYEEGKDKDYVTGWRENRDTLSWFFEAPKPGTYAVELTYACDKGKSGSLLDIALNGQTLKWQVKETGSLATYRTGRAGTFKVEAAGNLTLTITPTNLVKDTVMWLRSLSLKLEATKGKK
jgi:alpha-L-fucosidase